ncbi:hypothetical protein L873DRAFT_1810530 [Choiromyces venosus 120613-1]|uniref:Uncharacterized protein n=1 Tax=Choiromyces venosus 120613-1 TaxID=1336337 RepID=A0A3N4JFF9_9PEZI|nr:hypothetical protein L873DRAFT_1810530 [Choiromyces venosus 120613-1]
MQHHLNRTSEFDWVKHVSSLVTVDTDRNHRASLEILALIRLHLGGDSGARFGFLALCYVPTKEYLELSKLSRGKTLTDNPMLVSYKTRQDDRGRERGINGKSV